MEQNHHKNNSPREAASEEHAFKGNELRDDEAARNARDAAKVDKAISGSGQKMDSVHPDALEETENDRNIEKTREEA
jgi:hypothetical protein